MTTHARSPIHGAAAIHTLAVLGLGAFLVFTAGGCAEPCDGVDPVICDVQAAQCQEKIWRAVLCGRGDGRRSPMPTVELVDPSELQRRIADLAGRGSARAEWSVALELLGLIAPGTALGEATAESLRDAYGAYYEPEEDHITMALQPDGSRVDHVFVLAHEMVHAHQHQLHDLTRLPGILQPTSDGEITHRALIEGEAILEGNLFVTEAVGVSPHTIDWDAYFRRMRDSTVMTIDRAPSRVPVAAALLPYPVGGQYVADAYEYAGSREVSTLWLGPPSTFAAWMRGRAAIYGGPPDPFECGAPPPPEGFEALETDSFGAAGVFAWQLAFLPSDQAWEVAESLEVDRIAVYSDGADRVAVAWQLRVDPGLASAAADHALAEALPWRITESGGELLVLSATDGATLDGWTSAEDCTPPEEAAPRPPSMEMPMGFGCAHLPPLPLR